MKTSQISLFNYTNTQTNWNLCHEYIFVWLANILQIFKDWRNWYCAMNEEHIAIKPLEWNDENNTAIMVVAVIAYNIFSRNFHHPLSTFHVMDFWLTKLRNANLSWNHGVRVYFHQHHSYTYPLAAVHHLHENTFTLISSAHRSFDNNCSLTVYIIWKSIRSEIIIVKRARARTHTHTLPIQTFAWLSHSTLEVYFKLRMLKYRLNIHHPVRIWIQCDETKWFLMCNAIELKHTYTPLALL